MLLLSHGHSLHISGPIDSAGMWLCPSWGSREEDRAEMQPRSCPGWEDLSRVKVLPGVHVAEMQIIPLSLGSQAGALTRICSTEVWRQLLWGQDGAGGTCQGVGSCFGAGPIEQDLGSFPNLLSSWVGNMEKRKIATPIYTVVFSGWTEGFGARQPLKLYMSNADCENRGK